MPRLANVSAARLKELEDTAFDLGQQLYDVEKRISGNYVDEINQPLSLASSFLSLSRSAADLAAALLSKARVAEMEKDILASLAGKP